MRLGIFGGTFDPPHLGHLILAAECYDQLNLDKLLWVVTPDPPHKNGWRISPVRYRLAMVQAAIADSPMFEVSLVDVNRASPHYAVDTIHLLGKQYPEAELIYLIGGDSLHDLPDWHYPEKLLEAADELGVMRRPEDEVNLDELAVQLPGIREKVHFVEAPLLEISARQIRSRIMQCRPYRYYLHPRVYELIHTYGLYRENTEDDCSQQL
jgi:nicotinate-nucleotide adenylyltransferase